MSDGINNILGFLIFLIAGVIVYFVYAAEQFKDPVGQIKKQGNPLQEISYRLTDQRGVEVNSDTYKGRLKLVYFGHLDCPESCKAHIAKLSNIMNELGENHWHAQPVFISTNSADTNTAMQEFLSSHHEDIVGLTGDSKNIGYARREYGFSSQMPFGNDILLISPNGKPIYAYRPEHSADTIAAHLLSLKN